METTQAIAASIPELPADVIDAGLAARLVRCHVSTIHRWVLKGKIPGWYRGRERGKRRLLVARADVLAMIAPVKPANGLPAPECRTIVAEVDRRTEAVLRRFGLPCG